MKLFTDYGSIGGRQVDRDEFDQVSLAERDRRWVHIREEMEKRGVDCLLLNGNSGRWNEMNANIRYVSGYADPLSGTNYALFPLTGTGTGRGGAPTSRRPGVARLTVGPLQPQNDLGLGGSPSRSSMGGSVHGTRGTGSPEFFRLPSSCYSWWSHPLWPATLLRGFLPPLSMIRPWLGGCGGV